MKYLFIFILLTGIIYGQKVTVSSDNIAEKENTYYQLTGSVKNVDIEDNSEQITANLTIAFNLKNVSGKNLLIWKRKDFLNALYKDIPLPVGKVVSLSKEFSDSDIFYRDYGGSSNDYSFEWQNLRNTLDEEEPPKEFIMTLEPNESWIFEWEISLTGYKRNQNGKIPYSTLKKDSPIWLKTYHEVWSFNIEPKAKDRSTKLFFGRMLQKRWIDYGHLLLNDIVSEPILLDLNSVVIKTESQP